MANHMRVTLEIGLRGKKVVAVAPDWPGLSRGAPTEEAEIERLRSYRPRYAPVADLAGMDAAFADSSTIDVVEHAVEPAIAVITPGSAVIAPMLVPRVGDPAASPGCIPSRSA